MTTVEEVTQRIGALEQALAQANMIIVGMRQSQEQDWENIERLIRGAAGGGEGAGGRGREDRRPLMSSRRGFEKVPAYSGKPKDFDDWRFKLEVFLGMEHGFLEFLQWAEEQAVNVDDDDMMTWQEDHLDIDAAWINRQLYNVLAMNLKEPVLSLVKNLSAETETNGANAWRKVANYFAGTSVQRIQGLAQRVYSPARCKNVKDVPAVVEQWERHVREFEKAEKVQHGEQTRIHGLRQLVPEELSRNIQAMAHTMRTYREVKSYVLEQVASRRDAYFPKSSTSAENGAAPMDIGHVGTGWETDDWGYSSCQECTTAEGVPASGTYGDESLNLMGKGMKGKGYGKGQPFQGTCNHCGEWGHRLRECPSKDAEMKGTRDAKAKGKGKSPSEWQGKGWSNAPQFQPSWWTPQPKGWMSQQKGKGYGGKGHGKWGKGVYGMEYGTYGGSPYSHGGEVHVPEPSGAPNAGPTALFAVETAVTRELPPPPPGIAPKSPSERREARHSINLIATAKRTGVRVNNRWTPLSTLIEEDEGHEEEKEEYEELPLDLCGCFIERSDEKILLNQPSNVEEWQEIEVVMDSGSGDSVAPTTLAPGVSVRESVGPKQGQHYVSATGNRIPNLGEKVLEAATEEGNHHRVTFQVTDVSRPLCAVSKVCQKGNRVIFDEHGGVVQNKATGRETYFGMQDGIYLLKMWMRNTEPSTSVQPPVFRWQG